MPGKRKSRELALQIMFVWDANGGERDDALALQVMWNVGTDAQSDTAKRRALELATGAWATRGTLDPWIERLAPQWPTHRQPGVDRNILRLAIHELISAMAPPKVVIDEAIELAKEYSTEHSSAFVNGVLDAVLKERNALVPPIDS